MKGDPILRAIEKHSQTMTSEQMLDKIKELIVDYGNRYWAKAQAHEMIRHIEDGLKLGKFR